MTVASPHIEKELARLGLKAADVLQARIETSGGGLSIAAADTASPLRPVKVTTRSLSELKAWIGNPDEHFENGRLEAAAPAPAIAKGVTAETELSELIEAARHFVYDHSVPIEGSRTLLEDKLGPFEVLVVAATTIVVKAGHPLVIDGDKPVKLVADELIFEGGTAQIDSFVNLRMDIKNVVIKP